MERTPGTPTFVVRAGLRPDTRTTGLALTILVAIALIAPAIAVGPRVDPGSRAAVVVRTLAGSESQVSAEVARLGGTVTARLGIIHGFAATMSRAAIEALRADPTVVSISPDAPLSPASDGYDASGDVNSMASTTDYSGATAWWRAGYTGAGVDVVLIDTGVAPVDGLNATNKVVYGPDLSVESQASNLTNLDTFGHGTFMAGLIAGHDASLQSPYDQAPASAYRGMAPDARIVSIKVGSADGGTDVSQVIAAIDWVVQHAHDPGFNMRVINLSYGTNSTQSYVLDPLAYAAEVAWNNGIVVVAAGGNYGFQNHMNNAPALADPAYDPYLIAVGSTDPNGTATMSDDAVTDFSPWPKRGATRGVDLVAPGSHLQGLRVANSYIDANYPGGRIDDRYFRGSGTSESAAIVSGAAALILQKYPNATPDRVKRLLTNTGFQICGKSQAIGGGELQMSKALNTGLPYSVQTWMPSTGLGSLELARGSDHLTADGVTLTGEQDIMGSPFDSSAMAALETLGKSWSGGVWNGKSWSGNSWSGNSWSGISWSGLSWSGKSWSSADWTSNSWSGKSWSTTDWSGKSWSGISWSGDAWSNGDWT
jgi:subtilisin family serine protease